jgi:4-hydroxy-L-threonine phosphate dehydrogenase PdxA
METLLPVMPTCADAQVAYPTRPVCILVDRIATRLIGFSKGATVTAGQRMIFTAPAHGTAFDIVGRRKADPGAPRHSLRAAARFATGNYRPASAT